MSRVKRIMRGRANSFQKTMLQWDEMHPYNAVHVVRIPGILDMAQLRRCLNTTLESRGLTNLRLNLAAHRYEYDGGPTDWDVKVIADGDEPLGLLQAEIEQQLNTPFRTGKRFQPFRFFAVPGSNTFLLGLSYFHPVADAESIVLLLRDLVRAYAQKGATETPTRLDLYPDHRARLLFRHPVVVARKLLALPEQIRNLKQSHRPRYRDPQDLRNGFSLFSLDSGRLHRLLAAGKSWNLTANDLLLALILKSFSPLSTGRANAARRRKLSVGCIVNLRRELRVDSPRTFGLFLGSFTVTHAVSRDITLRELAADIRAQTVLIKRQRLYLATPMELGLGRFVLRLFSPERRRKFYQKHYPLWGGLTNMNLNSLWEQSKDGGPMDYIRGVSTGPVTPLVFSVTTVGDRANIGLVYRRAVFSDAQVEQMKRDFLSAIHDL
jgi:hypothetical protein